MPNITLNLTEPKSPKYLYLNPKTKRLHLMVPIVSAPEGIGLDNTCKTVFALQEFFGKSQGTKTLSALESLKRYQEALTFDIEHLKGNPRVKEKKEGRLAQVRCYITLLKKMKDHPLFDCLNFIYPEYPSPLQYLMKTKDANLYSMVLRPPEQDTSLRTVNPTFSLSHDTHNAQGRIIFHPSPFYQKLRKAFKRILINPTNKRAELIQAVLTSTAGIANNFEGLQQELNKEVKQRFGEEIDFTQKTQAYINAVMGFEEKATPKEYIDALLGYCAPCLFENDESQSPFCAIDSGITELGRKRARDELAILIQFFLAEVNIYCVVRQKTTRDFGLLLEALHRYWGELLTLQVKLAILRKESIEEALLDFINAHRIGLGLTAPLTNVDKEKIKQQFRSHFNQIKDSPQFDEFIVWDAEKPGVFVSHHGAICTDITEFVQAAIAENSRLKDWNNYFLKHVCDDYKQINGKLSPVNALYSKEEETIQITVDLQSLSDESLELLIERLPQNEKKKVYESPGIKTRLLKPNFLFNVARGEQDPAHSLLNTLNKNEQQELILSQGIFTDYSGRTFNCTAFEYAYWSKDTYMARMLLEHMDEETMAIMCQRIDKIEQVGLTYSMGGKETTSSHFNFSGLKKAYADYLIVYDVKPKNMAAIIKAFLAIGKEQRLVPAHVAHEYCYPKNSSNPRFSFMQATFQEAVLPRNLIFYNLMNSSRQSWYPLIHPAYGLGFNYSIVHQWAEPCGQGGMGGFMMVDLDAINRLDAIRTAELTSIRQQLDQALHLVSIASISL